MNKLQFTLISSFILFSFLSLNPSKRTRVKPLSFVKKHYKAMRKKSEYSAILSKYVSGYPKRIKKKYKQPHYKLHIIHLFTPSGIHFTSMWLLLVPLFLLLKKKYKHAEALFLFLLRVSLFFVPGFYSIKRICLYRSIRKLNNKSSYLVFLLTMILEYIFGTYSDSPWSFAYSYLFLGIIFSFNKTTFRYLPLGFFLGNLLIGIFQHTPVNLIGFFMGFFMTSLFAIIFPMFFLLYCFPWLSWLWHLPEYYFKLVKTLADFSGLEFYSTLPLLLFCILILKRRKAIYLVLILLISTPVINYPRNLYSREIKKGQLPGPQFMHEKYFY